MKKLPSCQSGQALLLILLVMLVGLTLSLTLISRTTTDIKLSRELEESARALSAAEAGIEEVLRDPGIAALGPTPVTVGQAEFTVESVSAIGGTSVFSLGKVEKENVGTVWLADHPGGILDPDTAVYTATNITICWKAANGTTADMEAIVIYKDTDGRYKVQRDFYTPSASGGMACDPSYTEQETLALPTSGDPARILIALRLKPIGADAYVAVDPPDVAAGSLPSQGEVITSTGKAGDAVRKVKVVKSYPSWPEIFDYVLFSGGLLAKPTPIP